ncbi:MAG TPA: GAF domain-containing protein [Pyrinomonadaceae bacterium]|nr:GAF domain-containing protein [Pyrinomonadaceae bacterium]
MSYNSSTERSRKKYKPFSRSWRRIAQSRLFLCLGIGVLALSGLGVNNGNWVLFYASFYAALLICSGFFDAATLELKRFRVVPAFTDVIFVSLIIHYAGGNQSSWFLLYFFPIISVSRYLGYLGSLIIAAEVITAYIWIVSFDTSAQGIDPLAVVLRCLTFVGIAFVAGNLFHSKARENQHIIRTFTEIDKEMLSETNTEEVFKLILERGLELTGSEMGHIRLIDQRTQEATVVAAIGQPAAHDWTMKPLDESFSHKVIQSKQSLIIHEITKRDLIRYLGTYFWLYKPRPRSALFVPILLKDIPIGVIAVYSPRRFHYTKNELRGLESLTSLIAVVQKNARLLEEEQQRLHLLYKIGEQLKTELELTDLFNEVVELTYAQLNSEEASLFIVDDSNPNLISKVAVKGPTPEITDALASLEAPYVKGDDLVGSVFKNKVPLRLAKIPPKVKYTEEYRRVLPSRLVSHYLCVPLLRGDEVLGVIRVINRRGPGYSAKNKYALSDKGFDRADVRLMQTIASQVAAAVQNAKLLKQSKEAKSYFENLIVNSPDPIIVLDEKGRIKVFNKACEEVWGYEFEDVKEKDVAEYYESLEHARKIGKALWTAKEKGYQIKNYEAQIRDRHGNLIPISLSASLLVNENEELVASVGVFKDLRELKELRERVLESERLADIGKFAGIVGHDIKHEMAIVLAYSQILLSSCNQEDDPERFDMYSEIKDASLYSMEKLQNMLMAPGPNPPQKKITHIRNILGGIEERMLRQARSKQIDMSIHYPDLDHKISVDIEQMKHVFWNLYNNSLHAIQERKAHDRQFKAGKIELSPHIENGYLSLCWKDNGTGISSDALPLIFNAFFTKKQSGSGLGLFISKNIVELNGGLLSVHSKYGEGTCFKIRLPLFNGSTDTTEK